MDDLEKLEGVYWWLQRNCRRYAQVLGDEAKDLASDTFLRVTPALSGVKHRGQKIAFLDTAQRHSFINKVTRTREVPFSGLNTNNREENENRGEQEIMDSVNLSRGRIEPESTFNQVFLAEARELILQIVETLPPSQKQSVLDRYERGGGERPDDWTNGDDKAFSKASLKLKKNTILQSIFMALAGL